MSKRIDGDRGVGATKVEGTTIGFQTRMVAGLPTEQLPTTPLPPAPGGQGGGVTGVTVTGPGLVVSNSGSSVFPRVVPHGSVIYREGTTITPAPAHSAQPTTIIHHGLPAPVTQPAANIRPEPISLPQTPVSVQYSALPKSIVSAPASITVAVTTPAVNMQLQSSGHIVQKVAGHGAAVQFAANQPQLRTVTTNNVLGGLGLTTGASAGSGQPPSFQRLKVEDALSYLDQVKFKFGSQPQVYNDFLDIMKEFKSQSIDTPGVISRVSMLFKGHPELIVGFNTFLPPGYKIEVQANDSGLGQQQMSAPGHPLQQYFQTIVHTPHGTHMMGTTGLLPQVIPTTSIQPVMSSPVSVRPVTVQPATAKFAGKQAEPVSAHSPSPAGARSGEYTPSPTQIMALQSPAPASLSITGPGLGAQASGGGLQAQANTLAGAGAGGQGQNSQPVEFNHAINYVNKIKHRFQGQPDVYKQFLEILHTYQKDQRAMKEGGAPKSMLTESEVYAQVSKLFQNQEDLLSEFGQFLPEATTDHSTAAIMVSSKGLANDHVSASANNKNRTIKAANNVLPSKIEPRPGSIDNASLKRPLQPRMQPPAKKPRIGVLKDVSLGEAQRYGTLNEFAFFDKVRKALKNSEVYDNFLRCLVLFNQEVVSRSELVLLVSPFLNKHPELMKWFKDFVGFRDGAGGMGSGSEQMSSSDSQRLRPERLIGDSAMEIDYASCKRLGASYCALPKSFVHPKCSGRVQSSIFKEVLNDTWVSFPSWSEDSQFVSSRKNQYEEHIYRTEDERFEFDVVLESNRDTIKVLECVQKRMSRMPPEEAARYRLDDSLGGSSPTIHQRAIRRIYGDKSSDIIDGLKRNPVVAVPLVLRRLKAKDAEWREVQKQFNKIWRDQNEKHYLKSLDHQGAIFKQNDIRVIRSKSLLNEIETLYDERHEQIDQNGGAVVTGVPHLTLAYKDKTVLDDAANLLIHHVKRQTSIHKEDKQKIKTLLKQSLPDIFFHPRQDLSDTESEKDDDESEKEESDSEESRKKKKETDKKEIEVKEEDIKAEIKDGELPSHAREVETTESYSLLMANNHWYLFLRLHQILCDRLSQMYDHAIVIAAEEGEEGNGRSESTAAALRLKPKNSLSPSNYYPAFKDMVMNVLDNNMDCVAYEDTLREMFGIHAFTAFTLDKVIANAVRQLQHLVTDESSNDCWDLYLSEKRLNGTGGEVATSSKRYFQELLYQKKSEKLLADENCFKIVIYRDKGTMCFELLDTESESRQGSENEEEEGESRDEKQMALETYVSRFLGPGEPLSLSPGTMTHLAKKPCFLARSVKSYRAKTRHKIVPRKIPSESEKEEKETQENDSFNANRPGLNRHDKLNLSDSAITDWEEANNASCVINTDYKILWVVNSENYIYKRNALNRAKQTHPSVCTRKHKAWNKWHVEWASEHVTEAAQTRHNDWMVGRVEGLRANKTHRLTVSDLTKTPYRTFTKFKVGEVASS